MTFQVKIAIVTGLAIAIALAVLARKPGAAALRLPAASGLNPVALWLAVVTGALIVVGFVSGTILRHGVPRYEVLGAQRAVSRRVSVGFIASTQIS